MTQRTADHGITIESANRFGTDTLRHASCLCGWQSALMADPLQAREAGAAHLTETNPTLRLMLDEVLADPDVIAAVDGLTGGDIAACRQGAAAAMYETVQAIVERRNTSGVTR